MKRLVALPLSKSFEIAFKSIRVRFFRSLITTLSLVLAVAFLCYTQVSNDVAQGLLSVQDNNTIQLLQKNGYNVQYGDTSLSASPKQRWIVFLSLLVCVVGIINAQLMSVTERFREIGTMKCLGALDRFIVRIFVIEAGYQGLAGSFVGVAIGTLAAILSGLFRFGLSSYTCIPWQSVLLSAITAVLVGTILSLLGVLYPALLAARMQPVEAMRVDQ